VVAGALAMAGAMVAVSRLTSVFAPAPPSGKGAVAVTGRHFSHLTNKQIQDRIERAGYKVLGKTESDPATVWALPMGKYVEVVRLGESWQAEAMEAQFMKMAGATARDGSALLHVDLHDPAQARALLEQIVR
jgi:hypothetical protein